MIGTKKHEVRSLKAAAQFGIWLLASGFLLGLASCRSADKVEAELRTRERELRELREEKYRTEAYNQALESELHDTRCESITKTAPELPSPTYTIKQIVLGRQTGGYDDDRWPGDEALQVVVEPRDPDGHAIKAPGSLHVVALEISPEGLKTPLSSWTIPPDQLRKSWRSGLLSTGYYLVLPWKVWPSSDRLRVIAQLTLADGRILEADKDVTIRSTPLRYRKAPTAVPGCEPDLPSPAEPEPPTLPQPRKVDGDPTETRNQSGRGQSQAAKWRSNSSPPSSLADAVEVHRPVPRIPRND